MSDRQKWEAFAALDERDFGATLLTITEEMVELLANKRASYGPHNLTEFGDIGVLIRTNDKLKRLIHMWQQGTDMTPVNESALDAWQDIAGYALLVLVAHRVGQKDEVSA